MGQDCALSTAALISRRDGDVLHLQLNRPDKGNALSASLVGALAEAVEAATRDVQLRLLVLSGAGRHFCTGFDLSDLDHETDDSLLARFTRRATWKIRPDDGTLVRRGVKAQFNVAAFGVELAAVESGDHFAGFMPGVNTDARVALFLGKMEMSLQACQAFEAALDVGGLRLDLLYTNTIRPGVGDPLLHALAGGGTDAVEIEAG